MPSDFDPVSYMHAVAPTLGLDIPAEARPGVLQFLKLAASMAALVEAAPLGDDTLDLDGVFEPVSP
ncbi:DUF4089 domain-containing protein [Zavarzinia aquatilis]|uniref:DUF4089 domain-containing protein n=1 Tax=Zavarzinia aquatilis TaxID=2211142 RepID=A0A317E2Q1_9PROT|nr:DUF4089 domain-containing protein [Zavarzinia aquatilis]PWR20440.1 hypothetical protein DKG74_15685 [Zavarzinia aquatilis]